MLTCALLATVNRYTCNSRVQHSHEPEKLTALSLIRGNMLKEDLPPTFVYT